MVEREILNLAVPPVETRFEVLPEVGGEARSTIFFAEWRTVSSKPGADLLGNRRFESISLQRGVSNEPCGCRGCRTQVGPRVRIRFAPIRPGGAVVVEDAVDCIGLIERQVVKAQVAVD